MGARSRLRPVRLRPAPGRPFTDADAGFLASIVPPVTDALRRCQAATFDAVPVPSERTGPVVLMLSSELEIRAQTPETDREAEVLGHLVAGDDTRRVADRMFVSQHTVQDHL